MSAQIHTPSTAAQYDSNGQISERNGIWVVTINGIWRGDYTQREYAVAAVKDVRRDIQIARK